MRIKCANGAWSASLMGGMRCSVCQHPDRASIDKLLAFGAHPMRIIAQQFALSKDSLRRHSIKCITKALQQAARKAVKRDAEVADVFRQRLDSAHEIASRALVRAEAMPTAEGIRHVAPLVAQVLKGVELLGKATGQIDGPSSNDGEGTTINLIIMPGAAPRPSATREKLGQVVDIQPVNE